MIQNKEKMDKDVNDISDEMLAKFRFGIQNLSYTDGREYSVKISYIVVSALVQKLICMFMDGVADDLKEETFNTMVSLIKSGVAIAGGH